jgi:hypothetical protein
MGPGKNLKGVKKMDKNEELLIEKLTVDLIMAANDVNRYADEKDASRNSVNYGVALNCASILTFLKQTVVFPCWDDKGFLRIVKVIINGKEICFPGFNFWIEKQGGAPLRDKNGNLMYFSLPSIAKKHMEENGITGKVVKL